jgi:hypothetical protein
MTTTRVPERSRWQRRGRPPGAVYPARDPEHEPTDGQVVVASNDGDDA